MKTLVLALGLTSGIVAAAAQPPQAQISNGVVRATVYLPDARDGFYRGTRFDWSGVFASLAYKNHSYFGPWFHAFDPKIRDFVYEGPENRVKAGACSAATGPVEEFTPLGYEEAKPGEAFVKLGVGALRKPDDRRYDNYRLYEIADQGKWTVRKGGDWIEFTQELKGPLGYAYIYRKTARLVRNKPVLVLEHSLKNTGTRKIETTVYDHNFLVMDNQPPGPDFTVTFPFEIKTGRAPADPTGEIRGKQLVYLKTLENKERFSTPVQGFTSHPKDYDIRVENRKTGAGIRITGDRPLARIGFWSIRTVLSPEPFIDIAVEPGKESTWKYTYEFYSAVTQ